MSMGGQTKKDMDGQAKINMGGTRKTIIGRRQKQTWAADKNKQTLTADGQTKIA